MGDAMDITALLLGAVLGALLGAATLWGMTRSEVAGVRARVAAEVHRRTAAALGMGAWPEVLDTVETLFWGALLQVRARVMSYHAMADRLDTMLELVLPDID